jgi:ABC-type molybdate transport system substrate-binding protein
MITSNPNTPRALLLCFTIMLFGSIACAEPVAPPPASETPKLPSVPPGKETDIKFYQPSGSCEVGHEAFNSMPDASLVLWVAGNQFFAMDDVVHGFQKANPNSSVGLITLPPGLLVEAIKSDGWDFEGKHYHGRPDLYASVNIGHLKTLKKAGLIDRYVTYMHNEMVMMVAKGNPKKIGGIDDLVRHDVHTSLPNPLNEGIMQFYLRKVLDRHGLWQRISAGKECSSCATTENNWFPAVHHRETPERILTGQSDVGVVWKTEALEALRKGAAVDIVELPPDDSLVNEVSYVIGPLISTPHQQQVDAFIRFLQSSDGQDAYAKHGFVKASSEELTLRPIEEAR